MTDAPRTPRLAFRGIDDVAAALRERGGRFSAARQSVLEALFAAEGPVSAEYIARERSVDLTSVYRTLERLEELGAVRHVHIGHGPSLYAVATSEREYLVCERCHEVVTVDPGRLDKVRGELRADFGYEARFSHFPIVGLCRSCAAVVERGGGMHREQHSHDEPHSHGDDAHVHPLATRDHDHTEHEHAHSHGDYVHSHPHVHERGLEQDHGHTH